MPASSIATIARQTGGRGKVCSSSATRSSKDALHELVVEGSDGSLLVPAPDHGGYQHVTGLDELDQLAAEAFEGYVVRKDLAQQFKASTRCRPTSASSCSAATAPPRIRRRSPRAWRSFRRSCRSAPCAPARRSSSSRAHASRAASSSSTSITARLDAKTDSYLAEPAEPAAERRPHRRRPRARARAHADRRLLRRGRPRVLRPRSRRGAGTAGRSASDRLRPIQLSTRDALGTLASPAASRFTIERVEATCCSAASASSRSKLTERATGRAAAAHGAVRRAQLQHGRARAARHRQVPPLPAGLAVLAPHLRRQGDRRQHVRQQRHRPARPRRASTTSSASTRSPASPSTRRTASTS